MDEEGGLGDARATTGAHLAQGREGLDSHIVGEQDDPVDVRPWYRYGKRRLYVSDEGRDLGFFDVSTMTIHATSPDAIPLVMEAARASGIPVDCVGHAVPTLLTSGPGTSKGRSKRGTAPTATEPSRREQGGAVRAHEPIAHAPVPAPPQEVARSLRDNMPGQSLRPMIEAAHAAGQQPTLLRRVFLGSNAYSTWERGAMGEQLVALRMLNFIAARHDWVMLHSVPVGAGDSDIDHVIVGPCGVFTLNAKFHPGANIWVRGDTLMVNGKHHPYVRNSRHEARRASRLLTRASGVEVPALGIVVLVKTSRLTFKERPTDVAVLELSELEDFLTRFPYRFDSSTLMRIVAAAEEPATWRTGGPRQDVPSSLSG